MLQFGYNTGVINAPEQVINSLELAKQQLVGNGKSFDVDLPYYLSDSFQHQSFNQI